MSERLGNSRIGLESDVAPTSTAQRENTEMATPDIHNVLHILAELKSMVEKMANRQDEMANRQDEMANRQDEMAKLQDEMAEDIARMKDGNNWKKLNDFLWVKDLGSSQALTALRSWIGTVHCQDPIARHNIHKIVDDCKELKSNVYFLNQVNLYDRERVCTADVLLGDVTDIQLWDAVKQHLEETKGTLFVGFRRREMAGVELWKVVLQNDSNGLGWGELLDLDWSLSQKQSGGVTSGASNHSSARSPSQVSSRSSGTTRSNMEPRPPQGARKAKTQEKQSTPKKKEGGKGQAGDDAQNFDPFITTETHQLPDADSVSSAVMKWQEETCPPKKDDHGAMLVCNDLVDQTTVSSVSSS